ncbi:hypothetical protein Droror1_Dr00002583 [Drosera rotundifolia]
MVGEMPPNASDLHQQAVANRSPPAYGESIDGIINGHHRYRYSNKGGVKNGNVADTNTAANNNADNNNYAVNSNVGISEATSNSVCNILSASNDDCNNIDIVANRVNKKIRLFGIDIYVNGEGAAPTISDTLTPDKVISNHDQVISTDTVISYHELISNAGVPLDDITPQKVQDDTHTNTNIQG